VVFYPYTLAGINTPHNHHYHRLRHHHSNITAITRIPTATLFSILCAVSLWTLQHTSSSSSLLSYRLLLLLAGATVNGPKTLLPLYIKDFSQEFSGTIGGIIGLISQLGCVGAGVGSGWILQSFGWSNYLSLLSRLMLVVAVLLSITCTYPRQSDKTKTI
jgi:sugar phosphate permease